MLLTLKANQRQPPNIPNPIPEIRFLKFFPWMSIFPNTNFPESGFPELFYLQISIFLNTNFLETVLCGMQTGVGRRINAFHPYDTLTSCPYLLTAATVTLVHWYTAHVSTWSSGSREPGEKSIREQRSQTLGTYLVMLKISKIPQDTPAPILTPSS